MNCLIAIGLLVIGFIVGWRVHDLLIGIGVEAKLKCGDMFVFNSRTGKWYPHNPRDGYR